MPKPRKGVERVFYATGAPANIIGAHESRMAIRQYASDLALPFSAQVEDFCANRNALALMISPLGDGRLRQEGSFEFRHIGRPERSGISYHIGQVHYGLRLLRLARQFKANVAFIESGATHYFMLLGFRLLGIPVVPVLHNALWPNGFPPTGIKARTLKILDGLFWRFGPKAVIAVSPVVSRQVREVAPNGRYPVLQARAQFNPDYFADIAPVPSHVARPFRVMFAGRITEDKGVLDIVRMAVYAEQQEPGLIHWTICGDGPDCEQLEQLIRSSHVGHAVTFRGWTAPVDMKAVLGNSHCCIVPTRSDFAEGLAMTAVEAVLSGRPVVSNTVVPAVELIEKACLVAEPDSPTSHADAVIALARDRNLYEEKRRACEGLAGEFLKREFGLAEALEAAVPL